jgi:hypothetical protein
LSFLLEVQFKWWIQLEVQLLKLVVKSKLR